MDVYLKDKISNQIQCEIIKNRKNVADGLIQMKKLKGKNDFLRNVYEDYRGYHNYIVHQKKDQELQILRLLHYLEKSMLEANLTESMIDESKHEHKVLLKQLDEIRGELKEVTDDIEDYTLKETPDTEETSDTEETPDIETLDN